MPLVSLLYRCPKCGHDPMEGENDEANCPSCETRFARGGAGGLIRVLEASGEVWEVPSHSLTMAMGAQRELDGSQSDLPQGFIHEAEVGVRRSGTESPVWLGGELLGFAEAMGDECSGTLRLTADALILLLPSRMTSGEDGGGQGGSGEGNPAETYPLLDIKAVQTSSRSLQLSPAGGGLVQFRFPKDSLYRWETLLRDALRRAYAKAGLGNIVEFQPRIVAE